MTTITSLPKATPGVVLIAPIKVDEGKTIQYTAEGKTKINRGLVISVGQTGFTDWGAKVIAPCKAGDIVWFLTYEGGYDAAIIDGKEYVFALFKDIRGVE